MNTVNVRAYCIRPVLAAIIAIATAFTLTACGGDSSSGGCEGDECGVGGISSSGDGGGGASSSSECVGADLCVSPSSSSAKTAGGGSSSSTAGGNGGKGNDIANYKTKQIGDQVWMAENLNYAVPGSKCGTASGTLTSDDTEYCAKYGRLYDWATAMDLPSTCNSSTCASSVSSKHQGICPAGWHIPTNAEWNELYHYADGTLTGSTDLSDNYDSRTAGKHLKAASGWNDYNGQSGNGLDTHGFAALPGGYGLPGGYFYDAGYYGSWWSASEYDSDFAYRRRMYYNGEYAYWYYGGKTVMFSVRCLQD